MEFLNLVESHLCHGSQNVELDSGRTLKCTQCDATPIEDVYEFVSSQNDPFVSCQLAEAFARWTGDENVPVSFILIDVEGILPSRIVRQPLKSIREAVELYKNLNAPFTQGGNTLFEITELMQNFLTMYVKDIKNNEALNEIPPTERFVLNQLLAAMNAVIESAENFNMFEEYFERLVPFVKSCVKTWIPLPQENYNDNDTLVHQLMDQLVRSGKIRKEFSQYCMSFDIIHVIVGCYVCSTDLNVVGNWALDLMARVCRGQFFWKNYESHEFVQAVQRVLQTSVSYRNKPELYYVIREIRQGNATESLSSFLPQYLQLEQLVRNKLHHMDPMVTNQLFPAILFDEYSQQAGFLLALAHVAYHIDPKTGNVKKGTYQTARNMASVIIKLIEKVKEFDEDYIPWTVQILRLFLLSYPDLEVEIANVAKLILGREEEE